MDNKINTPKYVDNLQKALDHRLKELGFNKNKRYYNRLIEGENIVHVIGFQLGTKWLTGKFTINIGVYIPEINDYEQNIPGSSTIKEFDCTIRKRIAKIRNEEREIWFSPKDDKPNPIKKIMILFFRKHHRDNKQFIEELLELEEKRFFQRFISRGTIISYWREVGILPHQNKYRSMFDVSMMLWNQGEFDSA
jgi:hypothetical protein